MVLGLRELLDLAIMTFAIGFIFSDLFARFRNLHKPTAYPIHKKPGFNWENLRFAALVTAPAVILHELGHKIAGLFFGLQPVVHAHYWGLALGVGLKLVRFPFIFFIPGYADLCPAGAGQTACIAFLNNNPLASAVIAFGGPVVNLMLWIGASIALKKRLVKRKYLPAVFLTKQINMLLFIINMIPIGFFDGAKVLRGLISFFGLYL